jgi:hypothetical protein
MELKNKPHKETGGDFVPSVIKLTLAMEGY